MFSSVGNDPLPKNTNSGPMQRRAFLGNQRQRSTSEKTEASKNTLDKSVEAQQTALPIKEATSIENSPPPIKDKVKLQPLGSMEKLKGMAKQLSQLSPRPLTPKSPFPISRIPIDSQLYDQGKQFLADDLKNLAKVGFTETERASLEKTLVEGYCTVKIKTGKDFASIDVQELPKAAKEAKLSILEREVSQLEKHIEANNRAITTNTTSNKLDNLKARQQTLELTYNNKVLLRDLLKKNTVAYVKESIGNHIDGLFSSVKEGNIYLNQRDKETLFDGYMNCYLNWEKNHPNEAFDPENVHLYELPEKAQVIQYEIMSQQSEDFKNANTNSEEDSTSMKKAAAEIKQLYNIEGSDLAVFDLHQMRAEVKKNSNFAKEVSIIESQTRSQLEIQMKDIDSIQEDTCVIQGMIQGYLQLDKEGELKFEMNPKFVGNEFIDDNKIMEKWNNSDTVSGKKLTQSEKINALRDVMKDGEAARFKEYAKRKMEDAARPILSQIDNEISEINLKLNEHTNFKSDVDLLMRLEALQTDVNIIKLNVACSELVKKIDTIENTLIKKILNTHSDVDMNIADKQKFALVRYLFEKRNIDDKQIEKINDAISKKEDVIKQNGVAEFKLMQLNKKVDRIIKFEKETKNKDLVLSEVKKISKNVDELEAEIQKLPNASKMKLKLQLKIVRAKLSKYSSSLSKTKKSEFILELNNINNNLHTEVQGLIDNNAYANIANKRKRILEAISKDVKLHDNDKKEYNELVANLKKEMELMLEIEKFGMIKDDAVLTTKAKSIEKIASELGYDVQKLIKSKLPYYNSPTASDNDSSSSLSPRSFTDSTGSLEDDFS